MFLGYLPARSTLDQIERFIELLFTSRKALVHNCPDVPIALFGKMERVSPIRCRERLKERFVYPKFRQLLQGWVVVEHVPEIVEGLGQALIHVVAKDSD